VMGLVLSISWIIYRERGGRVIDTVLWVWLAAWWGNIVVATYVFRAAVQSRGDWGRFFLGSPAVDGTRRATPPLMRVIAAAVAVAVAVYLVMALRAPGLTAIAVIGYLAAFPPVILAAALIALRGADDHARSLRPAGS
jgi:formate/nitrite transporter FocA (FNT family)